MPVGFVKTIKPNYAFVAMLHGPEIFAHRSDFDPELWHDESLLDRRVQFEIEQTERGPAAKNVKPAK